MLRETPLHTGHLRSMLALSEMGTIIAPPVPGFYARPESIDEMVDHTLGRVLDLFGLDAGTVRRWGEDSGPGERKVRPIRGRGADRKSKRLNSSHYCATRIPSSD